MDGKRAEPRCCVESHGCRLTPTSQQLCFTRMIRTCERESRQRPHSSEFVQQALRPCWHHCPTGAASKAFQWPFAALGKPSNHGASCRRWQAGNNNSVCCIRCILLSIVSPLPPMNLDVRLVNRCVSRWRIFTRRQMTRVWPSVDIHCKADGHQKEAQLRLESYVTVLCTPTSRHRDLRGILEWGLYILVRTPIFVSKSAATNDRRNFDPDAHP
jgi:hypothetical protein